MTEQRARRFVPPVHPFLLSAYPVLFLFQHNQDEVPFSEVLTPLLVVLGVAAGLLLLSGLAFRDLRKAGIFTSVAMIMGLTYGHFRNLIDKVHVGSLDLGRDRYLMGLFAVILALVTWRLIRARAYLPEIAKVFTVLGAVLLATSGIGIMSGRNAVAQPQATGPKTTYTLAGLNAKVPDRPRDIYYFIFDRYASGKTLKRAYDFDDSPTLDALRSRGFYVADDAHANYQKTALSLASSMNFRHLDELKNAPGRSWLPATKMVQEADLVKFLESAGYRYYLMGNWWDTTKTSPLATATFAYDKVSEFSRVLLETTILRSVGPAPTTAKNRRAAHILIAPYQFNKLKEIPKLPGPKFVFAHILMPHPPYVFDRHGNVLSSAVVRSRTQRANYIEQMRYTNTQLLALVDRLLQGPEEARPIVIIQSDEGPFPPGWCGICGAKGKTDAQIREKFGILSTYYFPGVTDTGLYPTITPVNSFRTLLNDYFGTHLSMLPDRSYVFDDYKEKYVWRDVTDIVRGY